MVWNEKEHKEQLARNEGKFFEEKMRLQQESNKKIEELAQRAHDEAIKYVFSIIGILVKFVKLIILKKS